jgi:hypothetical protein
MRRIAALNLGLSVGLNVGCSQRRRMVAGGDESAAAVLKTTSCSVTRTSVELGCGEPAEGGADPTSGVAGNPRSNCDMCGYLPTVRN